MTHIGYSNNFESTAERLEHGQIDHREGVIHILHLKGLANRRT